MKQNFEESLNEVLKHEGGYVDHPRDPGGATNKGITIATFRRYIKRNGTKADLRKLTTAQAGIVYRKQYWNKIKGDDLPSGVDYAVFDFAVNSGPSRAVKFVQRIIGSPVDGKLGPITLRAIHAVDAAWLINTLCDGRLAWLKKLRTWGTFGRGWKRRVVGVKETALIMSRRIAVPLEVTSPNATAPKPPKGVLSAILSALAAIFNALTRRK